MTMTNDLESPAQRLTLYGEISMVNDWQLNTVIVWAMAMANY